MSGRSIAKAKATSSGPDPRKRMFRAAQSTARVMQAARVKWEKGKAAIIAKRKFQRSRRDDGMKLIEFE